MARTSLWSVERMSRRFFAGVIRRMLCMHTAEDAITPLFRPTWLPNRVNQGQTTFI
jgi:hypothetical protein